MSNKQLFFYYFFSVIYLTPYLLRNFPSKILMPLCLLFVLILSNFKLSNTTKGITKYWILLIIWQNLMWIIGHSSYEPLEVLARLPMLLIPMFTFKLLEYCNINVVQKLCKFSIFIITISLIYNIAIGFTNPALFSDTESDTFVYSNAGGTVYGASLVFLIGTILMYYRQTSLKRNYLLIFILPFLLLYTFILNTRATTVLVFALMIILMFIGNVACRFESDKKIYILMLLVFFVVLPIVAVPMLTYAMQLFGGDDVLSERFTDLLTMSKGDELSETGSLAQRLLLAQTSFNTFTNSFSNFIWGIGENNRGVSFTLLLQGGIGNHSEFIDCLARYGIIGSFILYSAVIRTIVWIIKKAPNRQAKYDMVAIYISFFIYGILNNVLFPDCMLMVFGIIPLMLFSLNVKS